MLLTVGSSLLNLYYNIPKSITYSHYCVSWSGLRCTPGGQPVTLWEPQDCILYLILFRVQAGGNTSSVTASTLCSITSTATGKKLPYCWGNSMSKRIWIGSRRTRGKRRSLSVIYIYLIKLFTILEHSCEGTLVIISIFFQ